MRYLFVMLMLLLGCPSVYASSRLTGQQTVDSAGTAERLTSTSAQCGMLIMSADDNNADVVVFGNSDVDASQATRKGTALFPGQTEYYYSISSRVSVRDVWVDSETSGDGVSYNCLN